MADDTFIGKTINDSYEIRSLIARGGMAAVYRAHQLSMNRDVAIKVLPREFLNQSNFLERFKQEAAIAARLEHRAIVPVYDYGEWEGTPYIVMRLMEGDSVDALIEQGTVPLERTQDIIRQIASALDHAHAKGVLHRDLKPSNIMLDAGGDAFITDFGIARLLHSDEKITATGVVGTPSYMSPEQAQGMSLDGRSDVYSLGIVLFEMLTGERPFKGETPYSVAVAQVTQDPPSPRDINPNIPEGVEAVILKAIKKDPRQRYQTGVALAGALDDADLVPIAQTVANVAEPKPPTKSLASVPAPMSAAYAAHDTHTQPTPKRPLRRVQQQGRLSPLLYLAIAAIGGVLLLVLMAVAYLLLADAPRVTDFAATGRVKVTQTFVASGEVAASNLPARILYAADGDLYEWDGAAQQRSQLTQTDGTESQPAVSADGEQIAYIFSPSGANEGAQREIYVLRDGDPEQITSNLLEERTPQWLPDNEGLIYAQSTEDGDSYRLVQLNFADDSREILLTVQGEIESLHLSSDGERIVFANGEANDRASWEIYIFARNDGTLTRATENNVYEWSPRWRPNQDNPAEIVYVREGAGSTAIYRLLVGEEPSLLYDSPANERFPSYSPDGTRILFSSNADDLDRLWVMTYDGVGEQAILEETTSSAIWLP